MARQTDKQRVQQISEYVERHPGVKPAEIARGLELPTSSVTRVLPALEEAGHLLSEDRSGRLYPWPK